MTTDTAPPMIDTSPAAPPEPTPPPFNARTLPAAAYLAAREQRLRELERAERTAAITRADARYLDTLRRKYAR